MKTIKIIDLLNKIANGKEVPKKIIGKDSIGKKEVYIYNGFWYIHIFENPDGEEDYYYMNKDINYLNDEVEILEEEKKIPEKLEEIGKIDYNLGYIDYKNIEVLKTWLDNDMSAIFNELDLIVKNQNQLIDYLENKEKGDE